MHDTELKRYLSAFQCVMHDTEHILFLRHHKYFNHDKAESRFYSLFTNVCSDNSEIA
jgi:hypothetical protein